MTDKFHHPALLLPTESASPIIRVVILGSEIRELSIQLCVNDDDFHYLNETEANIKRTIDNVLADLSDDHNHGLLLLACKPQGEVKDGVMPAKVYIGVDVNLDLATMFLHRQREDTSRGYYIKLGKAVALLALHNLIQAKEQRSASPIPVEARGAAGGGRRWIQSAVHHPDRLRKIAANLHGLNKNGKISRLGYARLRHYVNQTPNSSDNRALALAHTLAKLRHNRRSSGRTQSPAFGTIPDVLGTTDQLNILIEDLQGVIRLPYYKQSRRIGTVLQPILTQPHLALGLAAASYRMHVVRWLFNLIVPSIELHIAPDSERITQWKPGHAVALVREGEPGFMLRLTDNPEVRELAKVMLSDALVMQAFRKFSPSRELLLRTDIALFMPVSHFKSGFTNQILEPLRFGRKIPARMMFKYQDGKLSE